MSYVADLNRAFSREEQSHIRDVLANYLARVLSYQGTAALLLPILGTTQPVDRLELVIHAPDRPLPPAYLPPSESRAKIRPWAPYEDQRLLAGIYRFGLDDWHMISHFVGNSRTKPQCSQRWTRGLDPRICKGHWSPEEDEALIDLVAQLGERSWTQVSAKMGNRCDVQCRYRYKQLEKEGWFAEKHQSALQRAKSIPNAEQPPPARPRPRGKLPPIWQPVILQARSVDANALMPIESPGVPQPPLLPQAGQISGQGSGLDFQGFGLGLSASGSFFGISPMGSLKFDS
jgi:hypothetical protein